MTENIINYVKIVAGLFGMIFGYMYGDLNSVFFVLCALVVIDFLSGILAAAYNAELDSRKCYEGIVRKIFIMIMVSLGHLVDIAISQTICMNIILFFYIANESLSITENAAKIGLPIPKKIIRLLEQLKEKNDQEDKDYEN